MGEGNKIRKIIVIAVIIILFLTTIITYISKEVLIAEIDENDIEFLLEDVITYIDFNNNKIAYDKWLIGICYYDLNTEK